MRMYRYLFFRIYRWALGAHGEGDVPHFTALFVLTLTEFINLMSIVVVLGIAGLPVFADLGTAKSIGVAVLVSLCLGNYLYLIHGQRLGEIVTEFEDASGEAPRSSRFAVSYVVGSLALFFGVAMGLAIIRSG